MRWRKKRCLPQKINKSVLCSKLEGQVDIVVGMFFLLLVMLVVLFGFRVTEYMLTSAYVEDALAASNLASAVIDLEEYGKSHVITIEDPQRAFLLYKEALCHNLHLDELMNTTNREVIAGKVCVLDYIVYNVSGESVTTFFLNENGQVTNTLTYKVGEVTTPDETVVESTTIYSRISFDVMGFGGQTYEATKEKSIDIVRCESE